LREVTAGEAVMEPWNLWFGLNDGAAVALAVSSLQNLIKKDLQVLHHDDLAQLIMLRELSTGRFENKES
jgi:hypothetical protein